MPRWPIEDASLGELDLDLRNVRIPTEGLDERAIISYLMEATNLLDLIGGILRDGYIDNELPLVAVEDGRYVVLEGNRRVASLKVIRDPTLLGEAGQKKVGRLLSRFPGAEVPTQLRVMVAPSRDEAQPLLARLHTRNSKESWILEQQAVFYHAQLSTMTVDQIRARYPSEVKIVRFIKMGEMRELILGLAYGDRELEAFVRSNQLAMSSLEYAYAKPKILQALGLAFNKDGFLESKRVSEGQRRGLMYLLGRFKDGSLHTRSPELLARSGAHGEFAEELRRLVAGEEEAPAPASGGNRTEPGDRSRPGGTSNGAGGAPRGGKESGAPNVGTGSTEGPSAGGQAPAAGSAGSNGSSAGTSRGPNRGATRPYLNMDGFVYRGTSGGMRVRFEELRLLDLSKVPNAAYDLLRTILECSIKDYFRDKGKPLPPGKTIGFCIEELAKEYQNIGNQRMINLVNAINRKGKLPGEQYSKTEMALNASNHEPDSFVSQREVHEAWEHMKPILKQIVGK